MKLASVLIPLDAFYVVFTKQDNIILVQRVNVPWIGYRKRPLNIASIFVSKYLLT